MVAIAQSVSPLPSVGDTASVENVSVLPIATLPKSDAPLWLVKTVGVPATNVALFPSVKVTELVSVAFAFSRMANRA
jgi:hypothetical protein